MSYIELIKSDITKLPDVLEPFQEDVDLAPDRIKLIGKTLEEANREHASWFLYYSQKRDELKTILDYIDMIVSKKRSQLFKKYTEKMSLSLSDRAKEKYIDGESAYLFAKELYLEVKEMYDKYNSIIKAYEFRGFTLNNITKARVAEINQTVI